MSDGESPVETVRIVLNESDKRNKGFDFFGMFVLIAVKQRKQGFAMHDGVSLGLLQEE